MGRPPSCNCFCEVPSSSESSQSGSWIDNPCCVDGQPTIWETCLTGITEYVLFANGPFGVPCPGTPPVPAYLWYDLSVFNRRWRLEASAGLFGDCSFGESPAGLDVHTMNCATPTTTAPIVADMYASSTRTWLKFSTRYGPPFTTGPTSIDNGPQYTVNPGTVEHSSLSCRVPRVLTRNSSPGGNQPLDLFPASIIIYPNPSPSISCP